MKHPVLHGLVSLLRRLGSSLFMGLAAMLITAGDAQAFNCPAGKVKEGLLCYEAPREGYSCTGLVCSQNCRDGYHSTGLATCSFSGSRTYTKAPYTTKRRSHPHQCGALWYDNCRDGYRMDVCGICAYKDAWETTRSTYTRGIGTSPDMSAAFVNISHLTQVGWQTSIQAGQDGYAKALSEVNRYADGLMLELFRKAGRAAIADNKVFFTQLTNNFKDINEDAELRNVMKRVLLAAGANRVDYQVVEDMKQIGKKLRVFCGPEVYGEIPGASPYVSIIPSNARRSSWGIYTTTTGAFIAGTTSSVGMVANCFLDKGNSLQIRAVSSIGNVVGLIAAATSEFGISWQPGDVDSQRGWFVGVGLAGELGAGVGVGVQWSVAKGLRGAQHAIPGFNFGLGLGVGVELGGLEAGNTWVVR